MGRTKLGLFKERYLDLRRRGLDDEGIAAALEVSIAAVTWMKIWDVLLKPSRVELREAAKKLDKRTFDRQTHVLAALYRQQEDALQPRIQAWPTELRTWFVEAWQGSTSLTDIMYRTNLTHQEIRTAVRILELPTHRKASRGLRNKMHAVAEYRGKERALGEPKPEPEQVELERV